MSERGGRGGRGGRGRGGRGCGQTFVSPNQPGERPGQSGGYGSRGGSGQGRRGGGGGRGGPVTVYRTRQGTIPQPNPDVTKLEDTYDASTASPSTALNLENLSLEEKMPLRPAYGAGGTAVLLFANYAELSCNPDVVLHRYKIEFRVPGNGDPPKGKKLQRIIQLLLEQHFANDKDRIATDYKSTLVTGPPLNVQDQLYKVQYRSEYEDDYSGTYEVRVVAAGALNLSTLFDYLGSPGRSLAASSKEEILQALDIVFGHYPKSDRRIMSVGANKHFYQDFDAGKDDDGVPIDPRTLKFLKGLFVSVRAASCRLLLNIQVKCGVCYKPGELTDLIDEFIAERRGGKSQVNLVYLQKFLDRVCIDTKHLSKVNKAGQRIPRIKMICGLARREDGLVDEFGAGPHKVFFYEDRKTQQGKKSGGGRISVAAYFKREYDIDVSDNYPVVNVSNNKDKPVYIPAEVCYVVPGQAYRAKLDAQQTAQMIKLAVKRPNENADYIVANAPPMLGISGPNPLLASINLSVRPGLITVHGRVLSFPTVSYYQQKAATPFQAGWNMKQVKFSQCRGLSDWSYLMFNCGNLTRAINETLPAFMDKVTDQGVSVTQPRGRYSAVKPDELDGIFLQTKKAGIKFLLVFLPNNDAHTYNLIKLYGDIRHGIHTVCCVASKFVKRKGPNREFNLQYFANVSMKFNLKLGGVNHQLKDDPKHGTNKLGIISEGKTMVVGIDVTHPSPGTSDKKAVSVAGVVASVEKMLGQWPATVRLQREARQEMVSYLDSMLKTRLRLWHDNNNKNLPENILVYRDGVSEGQYGKVLEDELPLMRKACDEVYPADWKRRGLPRISIVIVGKRHNTRFYPTTVETADSQSNPRSGTVVDRGVTETRNWDFYLQAHTALQGTARPGHYFVILDEIFTAKGHKRPRGLNNAADELEDLTHNLCYLYGRATKAVSICTPAYYADLVCDRARKHLAPFFDEVEDLGRAAADSDVTPHPSLVNSMYYI